MAFIPYLNDTGASIGCDYQVAAAGTYTVGEALAYSAGKLTAATGTVKPEFFSMENRVCAAGDVLYVQRIDPGVIYETTLYLASGTATLVPGTKYTLHTDGGQITSTSTSGVAELIDIDGTASGAIAHVRFN